MVIRKIFNGEFDKETHDALLKFGRGKFKDRFLVEATKTSKGLQLKTGPEYVNFIVKLFLSRENSPLKIKGLIVSTSDIRDKFGSLVKKVSNFKGVKKTFIEGEVNPREILKVMGEFPRYFYALSFEGDGYKIKVKEKAPKSGKPGKESEEGPRADFCTVKSSDTTILREVLFDIDDFKKAKASHEIVVEEIIYPKDVESLSPAEIRENSKRKGKIIRRVEKDGVLRVSEANFLC